MKRARVYEPSDFYKLKAINFKALIMDDRLVTLPK